ncbi:MAG TPA: Yip1 family protein [Gaiellaceae bacterium]
MREWWLRTLLVLQAPRPVFVALRDDSNTAAADRAEPVLLIILLAGVALALASNASHGYHGLILPVWLFLAGSITGAAAYWAFGAILYGAVRLLGSQGSYRRARHVLAYACVPLVLSLVLSPVGRDRFAWVFLAFVAWSAVLLVIGVRAVHGWTWPRATAAIAPALALAAVLLAL